MSVRSPEVDLYIAEAAEFARPILEKIREAFHAGCPGVEERLKWGAPSFEYRGMLGGMAAFRRHVSFGFWKARIMSDPEGLFGGRPRASAMGVRVESLAELPSKRALVAYVREARRLNEAGVKAARPVPSRRAVRTPPDLRAALANHAAARRTFESLAPSHRREYVEWIAEAKREDTRARRLATALEWLAEGKTRNWKYERGG